MIRANRSNSSNALNEMNDQSMSSSVQPINQSTNSSSRPMSITRPMGIGRPFQSTNQSMHQPMNQVAASAPVMSWVPPPAPSARPRLALVEPPPMELPPSPPVFSHMQMQAAAADVARFQQAGNQMMGGRAINQPTMQPSNQLQPQKYSRSLSSSAPAHHIDYLSQFRRPMDQSFNQLDDQSLDADMDEKGISINPMINRTINQTMHQGNAAELSKSPTIFSILTQHDHSIPSINQSNTQSNNQSINSMYRRSSLVGQLIDEGEEEPEDDESNNLSNNQSADDLQFSINLDEGEEDDQPSDLSLY